jgi:hypothetical protein
MPGVSLLRERHEWTSDVHVLVLGEITPDGADRDWTIEHPESCPQACTAETAEEREMWSRRTRSMEQV